MDNRIMLSKLKYQKNSKQPKKSKWKLFTQPLNIPEQQDEQVAVNAKNYLIQLDKDEEGQYEQLIIKQKSELDISLSQWSNVSKNGYRLSERYPKSISIHVNKLDQRKISSKQFSSMEMSLIDKQATNNLYGMRNTNYSHFMKRKASVRTYASPQQQIKIKKFSSNIQTSQVNLPSNSRVLSFIVRQQKTTRIDCTPKIDISYTEKTNPQLKHSKHKQKIGQNRNKLPRLDHLQSQQHKNKYKSIFRVNNRKNIILVPMHSPISKDLSKIDDLIREESIKLLKKHF